MLRLELIVRSSDTLSLRLGRHLDSFVTRKSDRGTILLGTTTVDDNDDNNRVMATVAYQESGLNELRNIIP